MKEQAGRNRMADSPYIDVASRSLKEGDGFGILPDVIGAIGTVPYEIKAKGLFLDDTVIGYSPPRKNIGSGQQAGRTDQIAGSVHKAMEILKLNPGDLVKSVKYSATEECTPLHKIFEELKLYENQLLGFVCQNEAKLAGNMAHAASDILQALQIAHISAGTADEQHKIKGIVKKLLHKCKTNQKNYFEQKPLENRGSENNESFFGMDGFDEWYGFFVQAVAKLGVEQYDASQAGGSADDNNMDIEQQDAAADATGGVADSDTGIVTTPRGTIIGSDGRPIRFRNGTSPTYAPSSPNMVDLGNGNTIGQDGTIYGSDGQVLFAPGADGKPKYSPHSPPNPPPASVGSPPGGNGASPAGGGGGELGGKFLQYRFLSVKQPNNDSNQPTPGEKAEHNLGVYYTMKLQHETHAINTFSDVVRAYHTYFGLFSKSNKLETKNPVGVATWRSQAFADTERTGLLYDHYTEDENKVVHNYIWYILVQRFEVFSSIVYAAFNAIVGGGSGHTSEPSDQYVRMGILSAMFHLFHSIDTSRPMEQLTRLSAVKEDPKATRKNAIISEIASIHSGFRIWYTSLLQTRWIPNLRTLDVNAVDRKTLRERIYMDLFNTNTVLWRNFDANTSGVHNLSIHSAVQALEKGVKEQFEACQADRKNSLLTAKNGKMGIPPFIQTVQYDRLRQYIFNQMKTNALLPDHVDIPVSFAAKVLAALNNQNPIYAALYLVKVDTGDTRQMLAEKTLHFVNSMLYVSHAKSPQFIEKTRNRAVLNLRIFKNLDGNYALAPVHLLTPDSWKQYITLSSHAKMENEKALTAMAQRKENKANRPPRTPNKRTATPKGGKPPAKKTIEVKKTTKGGKDGQKAQKAQKRPASAKPKKVRA